MKKVYKKQSLWSKILNFSFLFTNDKKKSSSVLQAQKFINKSSKIKLDEKYLKDFTKEDIDDSNVYSYNGTMANNTGRILLYVHGGNFVEHANKYQINFAKKIAIKTNSTLILPIYELLPTGNYEKLLKLLTELYYRILDTPVEEINFLGDSAGGGAILSFSMLIREKRLKMPNNIIMLSPWLDLSMSNSDIINDAKKDKMNGIDGVKYEGMLWADKFDVYNPIVSPMYGNFDKLGKMSIIFGGREILTSECIRFTKLLESQNIDYNSIMYEYEGHDFAAYPTKEGAMAINEIIDIINSR